MQGSRENAKLMIMGTLICKGTIDNPINIYGIIGQTSSIGFSYGNTAGRVPPNPAAYFSYVNFTDIKEFRLSSKKQNEMDHCSFEWNEQMISDLSIYNTSPQLNIGSITHLIIKYPFYKTNLAPIDSKYGTYESFEEWDYLQWLIDECHKRNIEFHAWFNPYRIKLYGISNDLSFKEATELVASEYANYPDNPASAPRTAGWQSSCSPGSYP